MHAFTLKLFFFETSSDEIFFHILCVELDQMWIQTYILFNSQSTD